MNSSSPLRNTLPDLALLKCNNVVGFASYDFLTILNGGLLENGSAKLNAGDRESFLEYWNQLELTNPP